jgi:FkbM family methyltransferase
MNQNVIKKVIAFVLISSIRIAHGNDYLYNLLDVNEMHAFLKTFITEKSLVFDVGANVGKKTELYLACGAKVICFEPQPNCVNELFNNFGKNANVCIEHCGLADKAGTLELKVCDQVSTLSTFNKKCTSEGRFAEHNYTWSRAVQVPVCTLDEMIKKYGVPQFCKIDVEGFEYEVLKGLTQPINVISFECNSECMTITKQCLQHLETLGYKKFNFAIGERGAFIFSNWMECKDFIVALEKLSKEKSWSDIWGLWGDVYASI